MVVVYSSRISGSETGLPMFMEHIFSFQHEIYWKRHDLKNALRKENFLDKILDTLCRFVHDDLIADIYISISMGKRIQANQCGHTSKI